MDKFLNQINEQNLEIVCVLIAVIAILLAIVVIWDVISKRKKEKRKDAITIKIDTPINDVKVTEDISIPAPVIEPYVATKSNEEKLSRTTPIEEIKYVDENSEIEKTKAKLELKTLKEELMKKEETETIEVPTINIATPTPTTAEISHIEETKPMPSVEHKIEQNPAHSVTSIATDLKQAALELTKKMDPITITSKIESDEEENAIISIDELRKASVTTYSDDEMYNYDDEGNEPISIQEVEVLQHTLKMKPIDEKGDIVKQVAIPEVEQKPVYIKQESEFKTTPYISPIHGIKKTEENIALEQTANYDKLNEEIRKTTEFLAALKELRKNLD